MTSRRGARDEGVLDAAIVGDGSANLKPPCRARVHPPFKRPPRGGPNESESWDFLGFTHYWTKSRKGHWVIFRKTMASRLSRGLNAIGEWCRVNRHLPVKVQHQVLSRKLNGHCEVLPNSGHESC